MECLIGKKGGLLYDKSWVYNKEKDEGKYEEDFLDPDYFKEEKPTYILTLLNNVIELEDGFTIRDWFKLLLNYPCLQLLDNFFPSFLAEYESCPKENCTDPDQKIIAISFQKFIELENYTNDGQSKEYNCETYIGISGSTNDKDNISYGLSFWPLKNYLDTPIRFEKGLIYKESRTEDNQTKELPEDKDLININYSLFDLIQSFIYEISFYGTPDQRDCKGEELNKQVEEIKSGKAELTEWNPDY